MKEKKKIRMAVIAGASHALKYKQSHKRSTDEDAIQFVTKETEKIF